MQDPERLSSPATFYYKCVFPVFFWATLPIWVLAAWRGEDSWIPAALWMAGCVYLLWWSLPMKRVSVDGDNFVVSNFLTTYRVPISHLVRVTGNRWNRVPSVTLHFEPPTPFGRKIRVIPIGFFSNCSRFDKVASYLRSLLASRHPPAD